MYTKIIVFVVVCSLLVVGLPTHSQEPNEIFFMAPWDSDQVLRVASQFTERTGIDVVYMQVQYNELYNIYFTQVAAGDRPDAIGTYGAFGSGGYPLTQFADEGLIYPLPDIDEDAYLSDVLSYGRIEYANSVDDVTEDTQSVIYSLPVSIYPLSLIFYEPGAVIPETMDEFLEYVWDGQYGTYASAFNENLLVHNILFALHGRYAEERLATPYPFERGAWNSPENMEAWEVWMAVQDAGGLSANAEPNQPYFNLPSNNGDSRVMMSVSTVSITSPRPEAMAFIEFLASYDGATAWAEAGLGVPARSFDFNALSGYQRNWANTIHGADELAVDAMTVMPFSTAFYDYERDALMSVRSGGVDIQEALYRLQDQFDMTINFDLMANPLNYPEFMAYHGDKFVYPNRITFIPGLSCGWLPSYLGFLSKWVC